jgi:hypothetical protein
VINPRTGKPMTIEVQVTREMAVRGGLSTNSRE